MWSESRARFLLPVRISMSMAHHWSPGPGPQRQRRALNRATAFHWARFDTRIGRHEFNIPAVRAPDDTLLYFVPPEAATGALFEVDFNPEATTERPTHGCGPHRIDHIARGC